MNRASCIALTILMTLLLPREASAQRALLEEPLFDTRPRNISFASRGSLDTAVITELIVERAQAIALKATAKKLKSLSGAAAPAAADLLAATAASVLGNKKTPERIVPIVGAALKATIAVRFAFPRDADLHDVGHWSALGIQPDTTVAQDVLRAHMEAWAYWSSRTQQQAARKPTKPACEGSIRKICEQIAKKPKALRNLLTANFAFFETSLTQKGSIRWLELLAKQAKVTVGELGAGKLVDLGQLEATYAEVQPRLDALNNLVAAVKRPTPATIKELPKAGEVSWLLDQAKYDAHVAAIKAKPRSAAHEELLATFSLRAKGLSSLAQGARAADVAAAIAVLRNVFPTSTGDLASLDLAQAKAIQRAAERLTSAAAQATHALAALGFGDATVDKAAASLRALVRLHKLLEDYALPTWDAASPSLRAHIERVKALAEIGKRKLALLKPLVAALQADGKMSVAGVVSALKEMDTHDLSELLLSERFPCERAAEAEEKEADGGAAEKERTALMAKCWSFRILDGLKQAIEVDGKSVKLDGDALASVLADYGDKFSGDGGGLYFHLTVGVGGLYARRPPEVDDDGVVSAGESKVVPFFSEQVGIGYRSPLWGDVVRLKGAAVASGLLYRAVADGTESDAFIFGLLGAVDLYELLELYVSPALMVYPSIEGETYGPKFGLSFGAQVPLGDYLMRLAESE